MEGQANPSRRFNFKIAVSFFLAYGKCERINWKDFIILICEEKNEKSDVDIYLPKVYSIFLFFSQA